MDKNTELTKRIWYYVPNKNLSGFNVNSFGEEQCLPLHKRGISVVNYWIMHYVVSGKGALLIGDEVQRISATQCFITRPFEHFFYQADEYDPWHYMWVGFSTDADMSFLDGKSVIEASALYSHFTAIMQAAHMQFGQQEYLCARMWDIMSVFCGNGKPRINTGHEYVEKAKEYIGQHWSEQIKVADISNMLGLDRSYFSKLFKTSTGISTQQYVVEYKMTKAYELICERDLSISDAAYAIGYDNISGFSRAFKNYFGMSPTEYKRGEHKTRQRQNDGKRKT